MRENYMILDVSSGNSIATFADRSEAEDTFRQLVQDRPSRGFEFALVEFDDEGMALSAERMGGLLVDP